MAAAQSSSEPMNLSFFCHPCQWVESLIEVPRPKADRIGQEELDLRADLRGLLRRAVGVQRLSCVTGMRVRPWTTPFSLVAVVVVAQLVEGRGSLLVVRAAARAEDQVASGSSWP